MNISETIQDVRYAIRLLLRRPASSSLAIATMALGIAATTTLTGLAYGVLLRPLPWPDADRLVRLSETREGSTRELPPILTNTTYLALGEGSTTLAAIGAYSEDAATMAVESEPVRVRSATMTSSMFDVLQARAATGTTFDATAELPGGDRVVVISDGLWQRQFGGRADAVGKRVILDDAAYRVVGVMPPGFDFPNPETDLWRPFLVQSSVGHGSGAHAMAVFRAMARMKPGVTPAQAEAEAASRTDESDNDGIAMALFGSTGATVITAQPYIESLTGDVRPALLVLVAGVGLLLMTAVASLASMQLARAAGRRRELAIRAALGAGTGRITRQVLVENLAIGAMGGACGVLGSVWLSGFLPSVLPAEFPRIDAVLIDLPVMVAATGLSLISGVLVSLLPIRQARKTRLVSDLAEDGLAPVGGSLRSSVSRTRGLIMAGQVAIAAVLLFGALLFGRSFLAMLDEDRGYEPANLLTASLPMSGQRFEGPRRVEVLDAVVDRLGQVPGVRVAAAANLLPLADSDALMAFMLPPEGPDGQPVRAQASLRFVSPEYFEAMGIELVDGRGFSRADATTSLGLVVVNEAFVKAYLTRPPVGMVLPVPFGGTRPRWEIAGVAADVRHQGVDDPVQPQLFLNYRQIESGLHTENPFVVARTTGDPAALAATLRDIVRSADPTIALESVTTMEDRLLNSLAQPRFYAIIVAAFALCAVSIAAVGLFGVLSYAVAQRTREIGVRAALGARPADVARLVLRQGLGITALGLLAGLGGALIASRTLESFMYGVTATDLVSLLAVPGVILPIAAAACYLPARRAMRIDPAHAFRRS